MSGIVSHSWYVTVPNPRPMFWSIAWFLWGPDPSFDSDGDAIPAASSSWTELTLHLRDDRGRTISNQRVDVDPYSEDPLTLYIHSENPSLALRTAYILAYHTGGKISDTSRESFKDASEFASMLGTEFDLPQALEHFHQAQNRP